MDGDSGKTKKKKPRVFRVVVFRGTELGYGYTGKTLPRRINCAAGGSQSHNSQPPTNKSGEPTKVR